MRGVETSVLAIAISTFGRRMLWSPQPIAGEMSGNRAAQCLSLITRSGLITRRGKGRRTGKLRRVHGFRGKWQFCLSGRVLAR